ncbi:hypothetical protein bpSLO_001165 (plasmid) [Borrelia parkeri]|uniref:BTA121 domain-containing protein surface lipoprotein n=1 Tax=Borrelia parkeri TaxID=141 RepID=UPI001FF1B574|nr:hypothetical protein [Borrelia parkeri]UPA11312.1 hypothetical protein bpSLO_001165 [Borrelia parkeri]
MVKIKCFSVLLVLILLLLLVISCDSGSKAGAGLGAGTNTRTVVKPVTGLGSVTGSGVKPGTDKELDAVTVIDERTEPKTEEETEPNTDVEVGDEEELTYLEDKVTDPKLKALLDNFGVSEAGRKAISYIQGILRVSYKSEFDDKFYNCLNQLGADVVIEKIIKPTVSLLRSRGKALEVIKGITDAGVKNRMQNMLSNCDIAVPFAWHPSPDHLTFLENDFAEIITRYTPKFRNFKDMVKNPRVKDVYAWLDADEQAKIDEIGNIVISVTYDKDRFNNVLNSLGDYRVARILYYYREVKKMQKEALKAIDGVSDVAEKQVFQARFNALKGKYNSYIRSAFNKSLFALCLQLFSSFEYSNRFSKIKDDAKKAVERAAAAAKASGAAGGVS